MKTTPRLSPLVLALAGIAALAAGIVMWRAPDRENQPHPPLSPAPSRSPAPASSAALPSSLLSPEAASELRGRRGIIKEITGNTIILETTDSFAFSGERVQVATMPATAYVLIAIPRIPPPRERRHLVTRTPYTFTALAPGDDIFAISFQDITASSTYAALRIEKIIIP